MPWVLVDDSFMENPKWEHAPCDSIAMWVAALAWCNKHERWDGRIPSRTLAGLVGAKNPKRSIADLEQRRAIHRDGDDHVIHDFAEWQRVDKKKAISDARRAAGKKGADARWGDGKDDGNADGNCHGKRDALPPTTNHLSYISDNSTPENTPRAGDNSVRRAEAIDAYAQAELAAAKGKGTKITSEARYLDKVRATGAAHPDLDRWLVMFPSAPASAVAGWLAGDKHSMGYYERVDEPMADVVQLRKEAM